MANNNYELVISTEEAVSALDVLGALKNLKGFKCLQLVDLNAGVQNQEAESNE